MPLPRLPRSNPCDSGLESKTTPGQTADMGQEDRDWYQAESKPVWSLGGGPRGTSRSGDTTARSVVATLLAAGIVGGLWWLESHGYSVAGLIEDGLDRVGV